MQYYEVIKKSYGFIEIYEFIGGPRCQMIQDRAWCHCQASSGAARTCKTRPGLSTDPGVNLTGSEHDARNFKFGTGALSAGGEGAARIPGRLSTDRGGL
jgi:hypothetical protein